MNRGDPKNWKEAINQFLFNAKNPSKSRKIFYSMISIIIFFVGVIAGAIIEYNFKINFIDKPGVYVLFGSINKDSLGYYIPIQVINSGQKVLHDVEFKVKTCYMDKFNEQSYDMIPLNNHGDYQLRDRKTFEEIQKKWCYPDINFSFFNCDIKVYILNSTDLYIPPQNCSVYMCDLCAFQGIVNSSDLKEPKVFSSSIFSPRKIEMSVMPDIILNVNISELEPFPQVGFNFFSGKELCILEGNCTVSKINDDSILLYLPSLPVNITLNPKQYRSINFSVNYANFGKIVLEEVERGRANISCKSNNSNVCPKEILPENIKQDNLRII